MPVKIEGTAFYRNVQVFCDDLSVRVEIDRDDGITCFVRGKGKRQLIAKNGGRN